MSVGRGEPFFSHSAPPPSACYDAAGFKGGGATMYCEFFSFCFIIQFLIFALLLLSSSYSMVVTQIRGHIAGSSPPRAHDGSCLSFFIARRLHPFLPSSTLVQSGFGSCCPSSCPCCFTFYCKQAFCSLCQTIWTRGLPTRDSSSITGLVLDKSFP